MADFTMSNKHIQARLLTFLFEEPALFLPVPMESALVSASVDSYSLPGKQRCS
jgi:hypothetical protein